MDLSQIVLNSFKYPFRNLKKLPIICLFFILIAIIPIGLLADNDLIVSIGVIAFFLFILLVPGYFVSVIKIGSAQSTMLPSFNLINNIYDSIRVMLLRIVYMIVPATVFLIALKIFGPKSRELLFSLRIPEFLATVGLVLLLIILIYFALKINKVMGDIRRIGIFNIIKWLIVMLILLNVVTFVSSFIISIPYVGFLIYICIVIPILESIANYSIGLLYSNIAKSYDEEYIRNLNKIGSVKYEKIK